MRLPACAVICLAATAATAQPHFTPVPRPEDPFRATLGVQSWGLLATDWDGDAAADVVFLGSSEEFVISRRSGAAFEWPAPLGDTQTGSVWSGGFPARIDVDADGQSDLVYNDSFFPSGGYAARDGDGFDVRTGGANPFAGLFPGLRPRAPSTGDLDGDGLTDLVVGLEDNSDGAPTGSRLAFVRQTAPGAFALQPDAANPLAALTFPGGFAPNPFVVDGDADGDADLVVICLRPQFGLCGDRPNRYYEQTAPGTFVERTGTASLIDGVATMGWGDLELVDADGDGDLDVFQTGEEAGAIPFKATTYYERMADGTLVRQRGPYSPLGGFFFFDEARLAVGDLDGDGRADIVAGLSSGAVATYRRTASVAEPFERLDGQFNPFHWVSAQHESPPAPALGDVDGDGDTDLVLATYGGVRYVAQEGTNLWVERTGAANPFGALASVREIALGDVDGDGDLDLVAVGRAYSSAQRFRFVEQTAPGVFTEQTGSANPFDMLRSGGCMSDQPVVSAEWGRPLLADLDADGDLDLVSGRCFFQRVGGAFVPVWSAEANPLTSLPSPTFALPPRASAWVAALADLTGDGILDALLFTEMFGPNGYRTYAGTGRPVASEPTPDGSDRLGSAVPNPASGRVRLQLTVAHAQSVRVALYDVLGRQVSVLHEGPVAPGVLTLDVDGTSLPAGVYVVRAFGESFAAARQVTIAR